MYLGLDRAGAPAFQVPSRTRTATIGKRGRRQARIGVDARARSPKFRGQLDTGETMPGSDTLTARAKAQGWPDGLIERAVAVKTPSGTIEQWLSAPAKPDFLFQIDRIVGVFERLA